MRKRSWRTPRSRRARRSAILLWACPRCRRCPQPSPRLPRKKRRSYRPSPHLRRRHLRPRAPGPPVSRLSQPLLSIFPTPPRPMPPTPRLPASPPLPQPPRLPSRRAPSHRLHSLLSRSAWTTHSKTKMSVPRHLLMSRPSRGRARSPSVPLSAGTLRSHDPPVIPTPSPSTERADGIFGKGLRKWDGHEVRACVSCSSGCSGRASGARQGLADQTGAGCPTRRGLVCSSSGSPSETCSRV
jgi:hypothetical protein